MNTIRWQGHSAFSLTVLTAQQLLFHFSEIIFRGKLSLITSFFYCILIITQLCPSSWTDKYLIDAGEPMSLSIDLKSIVHSSLGQDRTPRLRVNVMAFCWRSINFIWKSIRICPNTVPFLTKVVPEVGTDIWTPLSSEGSREERVQGHTFSIHCLLAINIYLH